MPEGVVLSIDAVAGGSSSAEGDYVFVGLKLASGETVNLMLPHDRAIDLIATTAMTTGQAARQRTRDLTQRYAFPAEGWEIGNPDPDGKLLVHFALPGGVELSFQMHRDGALRFYEGLGSALGVDVPKAPPGTRPN